MDHKKNYYDAMILGSGPAGNTAAIYAARNGFKTVLFTGSNIGGQLTITTDVENFPGFPEKIKGMELMNRMLEQSKNLGVDIIYSGISNVNISSKPFSCVDADGEKYETGNIIVATGASTRWLGLESESKFLGFGVSACATCDGNFFKNQPVAVIGGGDTAATEALHMANIASKVYLIYRRDKLVRMQAALANKVLKNEKIEIYFNGEVEEIIGNDKPKYVTGVNIINNKSQERKRLDVAAVFVAIGRKPETGLFSKSGLKLDENGYIVTIPGETRTNIKNIYAAGDVVSGKPKQAIVAAGLGALAALEMEEDEQLL